MELTIASEGYALRAHLARPVTTGGPGEVRHGLIICHGFPRQLRGGPVAGETYPQLADRLAADTGWSVLSFTFRGAGTSEGDFSLGGWLNDLRAAIDHLLGSGEVDGVWLAGFGTGGSLALCAAGEDERVRGVAAFSASADFEEWAVEPRRFLERARSTGVVRRSTFPDRLDTWARELREIRPLSLIGKIPPRPVLLVHGGDDPWVPLVDARALADAADGQAELRVLTGAGHNLRHDPRAVAVLLGWLDRQAP